MPTSDRPPPWSWDLQKVLLSLLVIILGGTAGMLTASFWRWADAVDGWRVTVGNEIQLARREQVDSNKLIIRELTELRVEFERERGALQRIGDRLELEAVAARDHRAEPCHDHACETLATYRSELDRLRERQVSNEKRVSDTESRLTNRMDIHTKRMSDLESNVPR